LRAIEYRWANDLSYSQAAANVGIPNPSILFAWEKRYLEQGLDGLQDARKGRSPKMPKKESKSKKPITREQELEAQIAQLSMENAYLKKLNALVAEREKSGKKIK
jgi:transposase-like protein